MAFHAFEDMNEFFDFGQLDTDHGAQTPVAQHAQQPEDPMAIDWAADDVLLQPGLDPHPHQDSRMHNGFDDLQYHDQVQWPLLHVPLPLTPSKDPDAASDLDLVELVTIPGSAIQSEQLPSGDAPSSSPPKSNGRDPHAIHQSGPAGPTDDRTSPKPLPSHVSTVVVNAPLPHDDTLSFRTRSSASTRQTSTSAWKPASAKRKGPQSRIPLEAKQILEDEFAANPYPCSWEMDIIAHQANLEVKKVKNWFNNTRARKKVEGQSTTMSLAC